MFWNDGSFHVVMETSLEDGKEFPALMQRNEMPVKVTVNWF